MKPSWRFSAEMVLGVFAYALGLILMGLLFKTGSPFRYLLVLLPIIPLLYVVTVIIREIARLDEMWRKIVTEAMAFSALATGLTCFSYIFVRDLGLPTFQPEWAFYLTWFYYGIGCLLVGRKYS